MLCPHVPLESLVPGAGVLDWLSFAGCSPNFSEPSCICSQSMWELKAPSRTHVGRQKHDLRAHSYAMTLPQHGATSSGHVARPDEQRPGLTKGQCLLDSSFLLQLPTNLPHVPECLWGKGGHVHPCSLPSLPFSHLLSQRPEG